MFGRNNAAWFLWLAVCFVFIGLALAFDACRKWLVAAASWVWLTDVLVTGVLAFVLVLVAYATSAWALRYAAVAMLVTGALVIVAGVQYLHWRDARPADAPHEVAARIGALSDGQAFERDAQARAALRARLHALPRSARGPARLAK